MKPKKTITYVDTTYVPEYSEYVEHCNINEREPQGEDSEDYWAFVRVCQETEWEELALNLEYSKYKDAPVIMTGTLGLWNGSPTIYPKRFDNLIKAIQATYGNSINDLKVYLEDGVVFVEAMHHDGTNTFEIRLLSAKGIKVSDNWDDGVYYDHDCKDYWVKKFGKYLY